MTQEFLKEILSFREIIQILHFQCKLYTAYMSNYQVTMFQFLKCSRFSILFSSSGSISHIFGPKNETLSVL